MDNEKDTRSQLTWLLPETVESTPKRHLGVLDLMLLSSSRLWKTANNLRMTVQLPLRLGVVICLVFRSEWEQWSLLHQHGTFTKSGRLLEIAETIFRGFLQSLEKVSLTSWSVTEIQAVSEYYRYFFFLLQELTLHQLLHNNKELLKEIYQHYPPHEEQQVFSSVFIKIYKGIDV